MKKLNLSKYFTIAKLTLQGQFVYKANFFLGRVRNLLQIFLVFFLWDAVFRNPQTEVFGYNRAKILTYIFGILVLRSVVTRSESADLAGIISRGDLTNYLLKPVNFIKYWFSRDVAIKSLSTFFSTFEALLMYIAIKPPFFLQTNFLSLSMFLASVVVATILFFLMLTLVGFIPFWLPEQTWPPIYLFFTFTEVLSGAVFPIDIFPKIFQNIVFATPFPHLLFYPLQTYLGQISIEKSLLSLAVSAVWVGFFLYLTKKLWHKGLQQYRGEGR